MTAVASISIFSHSPSSLAVSTVQPTEPTLFNMYAETEEVEHRFELLCPPSDSTATFMGQAVQACRNVHINCLNAPSPAQ